MKNDETRDTCVILERTRTNSRPGGTFQLKQLPATAGRKGFQTIEGTCRRIPSKFTDVRCVSYMI